MVIWVFLVIFEFAAGFAEAREKAGLTQVELAERANTTQATIARIERGDNISVDKLSSIARALGKCVRVSLV
ncbi:helix-turn-helix transcriptional regulator [Pediococcus pentosaceus]